MEESGRADEVEKDAELRKNDGVCRQIEGRMQVGLGGVYRSGASKRWVAEGENLEMKLEREVEVEVERLR